MPPVAEARSLNHWIARLVPCLSLFCCGTETSPSHACAFAHVVPLVRNALSSFALLTSVALICHS